MINIDLSKYIAALGDHTITAIACGAGYVDSPMSDGAVYTRLATVEITENDAGGLTYDINTIDGGVTVEGSTYNIITAKED